MGGSFCIGDGEGIEALAEPIFVRGIVFQWLGCVSFNESALRAYLSMAPNLLTWWRESKIINFKWILPP